VWLGSIGPRFRPQEFETCPDWGATPASLLAVLLFLSLGLLVRAPSTTSVGIRTCFVSAHVGSSDSLPSKSSITGNAGSRSDSLRPLDHECATTTLAYENATTWIGPGPRRSGEGRSPSSHRFETSFTVQSSCRMVRRVNPICLPSGEVLKSKICPSIGAPSALGVPP